MTVLEWDQVGDRRYETGIDRGVLYPRDASAVPWNGLVSVVETLGAEVKSYYVDGIPYLAHYVPGAYQAKLQAFTYPDELDDLTGVNMFSPGVNFHDQSAKLFNLSYRTRIGNDVDGTDFAYRIHMVFNVIATPSDRTYNTLGAGTDVTPFEWTLFGTPPPMVGVRPTAHISLDSRFMNDTVTRMFENALWGWEGGDPAFPSFEDVLTWAAYMPSVS